MLIGSIKLHVFCVHVHVYMLLDNKVNFGMHSNAGGIYARVTPTYGLLAKSDISTCTLS